MIGVSVRRRNTRDFVRFRYEAPTRWLFALSIVGYPLVALLVSMLDLDSAIPSAVFRVGVALLALAILARVGGAVDWRPLGWLACFWSAYAARLMYDGLVVGLPGAADALIFFVVTAVLPALALYAAADRFDNARATRLVAVLGTVFGISALAIHFLDLAPSRDFTSEQGRLSFVALNPISLGHAAVSTFAALLVLTTGRLTFPRAFLVVVAVGVAAVTLMESASRGPLVCFAIVGAAGAIATGRWRWLVLLGVPLLLITLDLDSAIFQRFTGIAEDDSALERLQLQASAISEFVAYPLFGSAYVEPQLQTYPHNIVIETAMSLGVVGLLLLASAFWRPVRATVAELRGGRLLAPLVFVQYMVAAQFSGAIYGDTVLWVTSALLIGRYAKFRAVLRSRPGATTFS